MRDPAALLSVSHDDVRRAVDDVFARPEFREGLESAHSGLADILRAIVARLWRLLLDLADYLDRLHADFPVLFWAIFVFLCLVLLAILVHIGWTLSLAFRRLPRQEAELEAAAEADRVRRFRDLRTEARERASGGQLREAVHLLLLALLALVEEHRVLRIALGWTSREIIERLRLSGELSGSAREFERAIERAWYGAAAVAAEDFRRLDGLLENLAPHIQAVGARPQERDPSRRVP